MGEKERVAITFERNGVKFNYRVVGVLLDENRVLLHRAEYDDFWSLPGGRSELGERAVETIVREMREELEAEVQVERLLWVVENFFDYERTHYHELAFYFLLGLPRESSLRNKHEPFPGDEEGIPLIFRWHDLDDLDALRLYPSFLKQALRSIPGSVEHVVHVDGEEAVRR